MEPSFDGSDLAELGALKLGPARPDSGLLGSISDL